MIRADTPTNLTRPLAPYCYTTDRQRPVPACL